MRFYTKQHRYYWGIDLHARRMSAGPIYLLPRTGDVDARGREDPLPHPLPTGVRILSGQRGRQKKARKANQEGLACVASAGSGTGRSAAGRSPI